uniref:Uncharacterized protein n=1 Tax=Octopus bimaculoides TaxID=37653 RepID=A0A0L8FPL1_OCTBM
MYQVSRYLDHTHFLLIILYSRISIHFKIFLNWGEKYSFERARQISLILVSKYSSSINLCKLRIMKWQFTSVNCKPHQKYSLLDFSFLAYPFCHTLKWY